MPEDRRLWVFKLSILLKEHTHLEDNLIEIFFFGVVMRSIGLNSLIILINRIELLNLFQASPAPTKQFLAQRRIQHDKVLNPTYHLFQLCITLTHQ